MEGRAGVDRVALVGAAAAVAWTLVVLRWFDVAAPWRPDMLQAVPPAALLVACAVATAVWLRARASDLRGTAEGDASSVLWLVVALTVLFRLPLAWGGSAAYVTPDGALSGLVALHARDGIEHLVFVPKVPYSGSLKSHLTAALALVLDPSRAFALASVFFYAVFAGTVVRLAERVVSEDDTLDRRWVPLAAGLYVAFAPVFLTRYSLSNDGNYVEVLALGTGALLLAARWATGERTATLALVAGLLLGLGFWCHILAVIHAAAVVLVMVAAGRAAVRGLCWLAVGGALGDLPSLVWNAHNGWESFRYVLPGGQRVGTLDAGPGIGGRAVLLATDLLPVLFGYDSGYPFAVDLVFRVLAWGGVILAAAALVSAARVVITAPSSRPTLRALLVLVAVNLAVAVFALPYIAHNPRYVMFVAGPAAVLLARLLHEGRRRLAMTALILFGAVGSLAQAVGAFDADARWRAFVAGLEAEGVRFCTTDFFLATKINFLSGERVICSSKLGPTQTEYFDRFRDAVDRAPDVALVAVNQAAARRLERRLAVLGVRYERRDLMKPVLLRLSRKVEPEELFPGRAQDDPPPDSSPSDEPSASTSR